MLIKARYQRAFVDFFEDQLVKCGYDWKLLLDQFLFEGKEPLINNMICGRMPALPLVNLQRAYGS